MIRRASVYFRRRASEMLPGCVRFSVSGGKRHQEAACDRMESQNRSRNSPRSFFSALLRRRGGKIEDVHDFCKIKRGLAPRGPGLPRGVDRAASDGPGCRPPGGLRTRRPRAGVRAYRTGRRGRRHRRARRDPGRARARPSATVSVPRVDDGDADGESRRGRRSSYARSRTRGRRAAARRRRRRRRRLRLRRAPAAGRRARRTSSSSASLRPRVLDAPPAAVPGAAHDLAERAVGPVGAPAASSSSHPYHLGYLPASRCRGAAVLVHHDGEVPPPPPALGARPRPCVNQPVSRVHPIFFTKSFLGENAAVLAETSE